MQRQSAAGEWEARLRPNGLGALPGATASFLIPPIRRANSLFSATAQALLQSGKSPELVYS